MMKMIAGRRHLFVLATVALLLSLVPPASQLFAQGAELLTPTAIPVFEPLQNEDYGYRLDIPSAWQLVDASDMRVITFASPDGSAAAQIMVFEGLDQYQFDSVQGMNDLLIERIGGQLLDAAAYRYARRDAILADVEFQIGEAPVRGYLISIHDPVMPTAIMAYVKSEKYEAYHDFLVSMLDSVSLDGAGDGLPGPMSQFYWPFDWGPSAPESDNSKQIELEILGTKQPIAIDINQAEASQVVIDREARVLSAYAGNRAPRELQEIAWERFFRMIYRDVYARLAPVADAWRSAASESETPREELPQAILSWLQGFDYDRPGGSADFLNPLDTLAESRGDCDSLVLLYAVLLDQLGFDSIIMVSTVHGHALAAVDVPGEGARFPFAGREWLVAELTAPVKLGMIDAQMADPADWMGFVFQRGY